MSRQWRMIFSIKEKYSIIQLHPRLESVYGNSIIMVYPNPSNRLILNLFQLILVHAHPVYINDI